MTDCFFCGSHIETMPKEPYFKQRPKLKIDRYFIDKRDKKTMCKLCGTHYIERQYFDLVAWPKNGGGMDMDEFVKFVVENFDKVML